MKVFFFAQSRLIAGSPEHVLEIKQPLTQAEFWALLIKIFPDLAPLQKTSRLARQETYLVESDLLHPGDEIALIPPVSGG